MSDNIQEIKSQSAAGVDDFINHISQPVQEVNFDFDAAFPEDAEIVENAPGTETPPNDINEFYDYDREHLETAKMMWGLLDRGMAFAAATISREPMARFQQITDEKPVSKNTLDVTAALIKKHSLKLTLEQQLGIIIVGMYAPVFIQAMMLRESNLKKAKNGQKKAAAARRAQEGNATTSATDGQA